MIDPVKNSLILKSIFLERIRIQMTKMMMIKTRKKIRRTETRNITRMMMAKPIKKFVHREKI